MAYDSVLVENGESVMQGQVLGKIGSSGSSTGGHLHFELRIGGNTHQNTVDPLLYISASAPRKTGMEYQYDEDGNIISDGSVTNATLYIQSWEGTPKYLGNDYVVFDDGYGTPTVGWGVVPKYNVSKFAAFGIDTNDLVLGSTVPIDIVDNIKNQVVQGFSDSIKSMLSNNGIVLTSYQIDALISRAYNCGLGGLTGFPEAYKQYGNTEALYENFLNRPYTSNGQISKGLQRRRLAEWLLFSQGQYKITV